MSSQTPDKRRPGWRVASVQLPIDQHEALKALAESEHRTLSGELRRLIAERLEAS